MEFVYAILLIIKIYASETWFEFLNFKIFLYFIFTTTLVCFIVANKLIETIFYTFSYIY